MKTCTGTSSITCIEAYIEYSNKTDNTVLKALEVLEKGESFPKAPEPEQES